MSNTLTGKVYQVLKQESGQGEKGEWIKQPIVIETLGQYPKKVMLEMWGNIATKNEHLKEGQEVTISFNPESREHNGKWFTSLRAWKIEVKGAPKETETVQTGEEEDLPF